MLFNFFSICFTIINNSRAQIQHDYCLCMFLIFVHSFILLLKNYFLLNVKEKKKLKVTSQQNPFFPFKNLALE